MAAQILSVLCFLLVLIQNAAGSLVLDVNPTDIYPGVTHSLTVNCSFSFDDVSDIVDIITLIIAKENQQEKFEDLASISIFTPEQITEKVLLNGTASGHISPDDQSFVSIHWSFPAASEDGLYRCEVSGVNSSGRPAQRSQTMLVTSKKPSIDQLTNKVSDLQHQLDGQDTLINSLQQQLDGQEILNHNLQLQLNLQETLNQNQSQTIDMLLSLVQAQSAMISSQSATISSQTDTITDIQNRLNLQHVPVELAFNISTQYQGHYYLLSKASWHNSTVSEQTCEAYGGYLVEINDSKEQEFVRGFLNNLDGFSFVLISGTQEGHPGNWTYTSNGGPLTYTGWATGKPDQAINNLCIYMTIDVHWQWWNMPCTNTVPNRYFMCEVNIN